MPYTISLITLGGRFPVVFPICVATLCAVVDMAALASLRAQTKGQILLARAQVSDCNLLENEEDVKSAHADSASLITRPRSGEKPRGEGSSNACRQQSTVSAAEASSWQSGATRCRFGYHASTADGHVRTVLRGGFRAKEEFAAWKCLMICVFASISTPG
ncbi:hypothetical protein EJB05_31257, partial [Eragrostis curvula]